jgi:peptidoglycan hydrolase-like protein with peptidoglycan-binding domain
LRKLIALLSIIFLLPAWSVAAPKSTKKTVSAKSKKKRSARRARVSWRNRQLHPTPSRYQEIQQALIDKKYLQGAATGRWDEECEEALRRFQREQNLEPTGKLDSLTLIGLGLGPKYETAAISEQRPEAQP